MRNEKVLGQFLQAQSIARVENGEVVNQKEIDRILRIALDEYAHLVEERLPFSSPYRVIEEEGNVFLVPDKGSRVVISDCPLYMGPDYIKKTRQREWGNALSQNVDMLFDDDKKIRATTNQRLSIEDKKLKHFIQNIIHNSQQGVKTRKWTGHYSISGVIDAFKAYHQSIDVEARALAGRSYARLTFERYVSVRNHQAEFSAFEKEGAPGIRHLFPELDRAGFCPAIFNRCSKDVMLLLREKGLRYLYNIHEHASEYLNAKENIIDLSAVSAPALDRAEDRSHSLIERANTMIDALNEAVRRTGELPPEQLLFSFFSSAMIHGHKPFVAACTLFSSGRALMRELMPYVRVGLARSERMASMSNDDCCALIQRAIHNAEDTTNRCFKINDVLFKVVSRKNQKQSNAGSKLLAIYIDPDSGLPTCKVVKKSYFKDHKDPNSINAFEVSRAAGFVAKEINEQIRERPSRLFILIGTDHALNIYASTPQGERMLKGKAARGFLERLALSSVKRKDKSLFAAVLSKMNGEGYSLLPKSIAPEDRAWLLKESKGEFMSLILSQPTLQGHQSACIDQKWIQEAITSQAGIALMDLLIDHLNEPLEEHTLQAFDRYHARSHKLESFLDSYKMISSIQDGGPDCQDFHDDQPSGPGRIPRAAIARNTL